MSHHRDRHRGRDLVATSLTDVKISFDSSPALSHGFLFKSLFFSAIMTANIRTRGPSRMYLLLIFLTTLIATALAQSNGAAQNATAFALAYGYPLLAFEKLAPLLANTIGVNQLYNARTLDTAADRQVVKPNVDTLYSTAIFDLSHNDVIVTVPDVPSSQFALFSYYDPYGDNFANTGTGNVDAGGQYKLAVRPNGTSSYGVQATNGSSNQYQATIYSPSTYGILLIRWLVNATNLDAVHTYQNATSVQSATTGGSGAPYLTELKGSNSSQTPAENVLDLLAQFADFNGPEMTSDASTVSEALAAAGLSQGNYTEPTGVNLTSANQTALVSAIEAAASALMTLNNGWSMIAQNETGDFGSNYGLRVAIASSGYLMLKAPNAVYPSWSNSSGGALGSTLLSLGSDEALLYTFSGKPPLKETGFWSLTAYDADGYLIDNERNVYALGDRSNITYADGVRVYGANASTQDDEFQLLVQPADVTPPVNWTSNWLPGPAGGGSITVLLRCYGAEDTLLNGSYAYPLVTRQAAITGAGNGTTNTTATSAPSATYTGASSGYIAVDRVVVIGAFVLALAVAVIYP